MNTIKPKIQLVLSDILKPLGNLKSIVNDDGLFLIHDDGAKTKFVANNGTFEMEYAFSFTCGQYMSVVLPLHAFHHVCSNTNETTITHQKRIIDIMVDSDKVQVIEDCNNYKHFEYPVNGKYVGFVRDPHLDNVYSEIASVNGKDLRTALNHTYYATKKKDVREFPGITPYDLCSGVVLFDFVENDFVNYDNFNKCYLNIVATDRNRIAMESMNFTNVTKFGRFVSTFFVSYSSIDKIRKHIPDDDISIVGRNSDTIEFRCGNLTMRTSLVDIPKIAYPNYLYVIPHKEDVPFVLQFECDQLRNAIDQLIARFKTVTSFIVFNLKPDGVVISMSDGYRSSVSLDIGHLEIKYSGEAMQISFISAHIIDPLKYVKAERVSFHFKNNDSMILLRFEGVNNFNYVINPTRGYIRARGERRILISNVASEANGGRK